ncbi:MAG: biotin--[acetyl-CoA-carboxylase] ligase [Dysgonomonas sp.]
MPCYIHLEETESTNNYIKNELLTESKEDDIIIVSTDHQTAGKGQRGNNWESEKGKNLTFSILFHPTDIEANQQFIISQFTSLAIKDTLSQYTKDISIKWPNDIYWKNKKICGILIENSLIDTTIASSIIGIGLNINQTEFTNKAPNPISLKQITGNDYDLDKVLHEVIDRISLYYNKIDKNGSEDIAKRYKNSLFRHEGYHTYNDGTHNFMARIKDIEPSGLLVLEMEDGSVHKYAFKEIKYIL